MAFVFLAVPQRLIRSLCPGPAVSLQLPAQPGGACLRSPEWCASSQALAQDPGPLRSLPRSSSCPWLGGKNFCVDKAIALGTPLTTGISSFNPARVLSVPPLPAFEKRNPSSCHPEPRSPKLGPWSQHVSPLLCIGLCPLPVSMAEHRQVPGGRETPQGELRPEVVEDEVPRSPVAEEPRGDGSNSSEAKLFPGDEEELDPRIQVRGLMGERQGC